MGPGARTLSQGGAGQGVNCKEYMGHNTSDTVRHAECEFRQPIESKKCAFLYDLPTLDLSLISGFRRTKRLVFTA
jgi:hypothetical protein